MNPYTIKLWRVVALHESPTLTDPQIADTPERIAAFYHETIALDPRHSKDVESLYVIHMNTRRRIIGYHLVATGTLDRVLSHSREVFRAAIVANCAAIVLLHNHPSGDPTPSEGDIRVTRDLIRAGQVLKIDVIDSVIIGNATPDRPQGYFSLREHGYFN